MASRDVDYPVEQDAHQTEAQKHKTREGGRRRRLRRVVYVYDDESNDDFEQPIFSGQEKEPAYVITQDEEMAKKEVISVTSESSSKSTHCCECCQKKKPISPANPRIGSPTPLGFYAFGITTMLYNVHTAGITTHNMATMGLVMFFGGLTQFICGFFELINMNTLGCTISATYGAFWMATAYMFNVPVDTTTDLPLTQGGNNDYLGGFFLAWFFFAASLFACAFTDSTPLLGKLLFFLVPLNFLLQAIGNFALVPTLVKVAGFIGIVMGALATYLGIAFQMRDVYGRSILPLLFTKGFRVVEL